MNADTAQRMLEAGERAAEIENKAIRASNCLIEADHLTSEDRRKEYGHPLDNFDATARIIEELIFARYKVQIEVTADFVGLLMLAVKLAREANKSSRSNLEDIAGYARCIELVHQEQEKRSGK